MYFLLSFQIKNLIIFDLINNENRLSRYETEEAVPKLKVTQQLIEEIYTAHDPHPRPKPCPIKPMRSAIKWPCNIVVKILGHLSLVVKLNSFNIDIWILIFDVYNLFFSLWSDCSSQFNMVQSQKGDWPLSLVQQVSDPQQALPPLPAPQFQPLVSQPRPGASPPSPWQLQLPLLTVRAVQGLNKSKAHEI